MGRGGVRTVPSGFCVGLAPAGGGEVPIVLG